MLRLFFPLVLLLFVSQLSVGQGLSTSVSLSDWGLSDVQSVERAQFSIVHEKGGDRLEMRALYDASAFRFTPPPSGTRLDVTDFTDGFVNFLGGSYSAYGVNGGSADVNHHLTEERTRALAVTYDRGDGGYCGVWMHLFNSAAPSTARRYFDSSPYKYLAVLIRGMNGNEKVVLKVADEAWNKKEDALPVGDINRYTPGARIDTMWQTALIPLGRALAGVDRTKLATLAFEAFSPSAGSFELGTISFLRDSSSLSAAAVPKPRVEHRSMQKALWVWETTVLVEKSEQEKLVGFVQSENIDNVFLGLPYDSTMATRQDGLIVDSKTLGPIVRSLNAAGVRVHALAGDKDFILPDRREFVKRGIQNIVDYNKSAPPGEQFYAIHLDVEPYLFPGFGSSRQQWFLQNFLETLNECARIAHDGGMLIGADTPFWFDGINEMTQLPIVASFNGITKPLYQHVLDMMDNVTLMDYRTSVEGENGIVQLATKELEYADRTGKQIFVGLETSPLPDETILTFIQAPTRGIPGADPGPQYMVCVQKEQQLHAAILSTKEEILGFLGAHQAKERDLFFWKVERSTRVPGSMTSFATLGGEAVLEAMNTATPLLRKHPSFLGFAIHYYGSYVKMMGENRSRLR